MQVLMVVNAAQAEEVLFDRGAAASLPRGSVVVISSTVPASAATAIASRLTAMVLFLHNAYLVPECMMKCSAPKHLSREVLTRVLTDVSVLCQCRNETSSLSMLLCLAALSALPRGH